VNCTCTVHIDDGSLESRKRKPPNRENATMNRALAYPQATHLKAGTYMSIPRYRSSTHPSIPSFNQYLLFPALRYSFPKFPPSNLLDTYSSISLPPLIQHKCKEHIQKKHKIILRTRSGNSHTWSIYDPFFPLLSSDLRRVFTR
jgi:hypothetical protein